MNGLKRMLVQKLGAEGVLAVKRLRYGSRGEPFQYGPHALRYVPGSRPVPMEYLNSESAVPRNDVKQQQFFLERVKPGDFVLDVGAHHGQYAVMLGALVGESGRVISFEPDEAARSTLHQNLALNGLSERVKVETVALSNERGTHAFFSCGGDSSSSMARTGMGYTAQSPHVTEHTVHTVPMDEYLSQNGLDFPRFIKIDTEGAEVNILRGARETLRSGAVILCELHPYAWDEFNTSFEELKAIVGESGRTMKYLDASQKIEDVAVYGAVIIS